MTKRFLDAVEFVLKSECVYEEGHYGELNHVISEHDKHDPGGLTKFGIDQRAHPDTDIESLTLAQAKMIYESVYWKRCRAEDMPPGYGEVLFDIKVNGGNGPLMLQQALTELGSYKGKPDGNLGPLSKQAMILSGKLGLKRFLQIRQQRFERLAVQDQFKPFLKGWKNRNDNLAKFVGVQL